jgi:hypothetical protein
MAFDVLASESGNPEVIHLAEKRAFRGSREASFVYACAPDLFEAGGENWP